MEPPTPSKWSPRPTVLAFVLAVAVVSAAYSTPVLAQDDTEPTASFDSDSELIVLETGPEQTITGTTSLEKGSTVSIRMRSANSETPFIKSAEVSVDENGDFTATFDTSNVVDENSTAEFTVTLHANDDRIVESEGIIVGDNAEYTTESTTSTSTSTTAANAPGFGVSIALLGAALTGGVIALRPE